MAFCNGTDTYGGGKGLTVYVNGEVAKTADNVGKHTVLLATHEHNIVTVDAKVPTYTSAGWNEYEYCTSCDHTTYQELEMLEAPSVSFDRSVLTEADFTVKDGDTYLLNKAGCYRFVVNCKQGDRLVDKIYTVKVEKDGGVPDVTFADGKIKLSTNGVKVNKMYLAYNGEQTVNVTNWTDYCEKAIARACYQNPADESEYTLANNGCYTVLVNYFDGNKNVDKYFTINN